MKYLDFVSRSFLKVNPTDVNEVLHPSTPPNDIHRSSLEIVGSVQGFVFGMYYRELQCIYSIVQTTHFSLRF